MGQARLPVRKIREVLRLKAEGFSDRQIAAAIGSARSTVQECARRARDAGVTWPLPPAMDEAALHAHALQARGAAVAHTATGFCLPACGAAPPRRHPIIAVGGVQERSSGRVAVQRFLRAVPPLACRPRSWCCARSTRPATSSSSITPDRRCRSRIGTPEPLVPRKIFVAVLGFSNYTHAEATVSQGAGDWLGAHVRALEYFGGAPRAIVPDNLTHRRR